MGNLDHVEHIEHRELEPAVDVEVGGRGQVAHRHDRQPDLLEHLAAERLLRRLARVDEASRHAELAPGRIPGAADEKHLPIRIRHDRGDGGHRPEERRVTAAVAAKGSERHEFGPRAAAGRTKPIRRCDVHGRSA